MIPLLPWDITWTHKLLSNSSMTSPRVNLKPLASAVLKQPLIHLVHTDSNANNEIYARGDYYLDVQTGFLAGLVLNSGDDPAAEGTTINLGFNKFLSPTVKLALEYDDFMAKDSNYDSNTIDVEIEARF